MANFELIWDLKLQGANQAKNDLDAYLQKVQQGKGDMEVLNQKLKAYDKSLSDLRKTQAGATKEFALTHPELFQMERGFSALASSARGFMSIYNSMNIDLIRRSADQQTNLNNLRAREQTILQHIKQLQEAGASPDNSDLLQSQQELTQLKAEINRAGANQFDDMINTVAQLAFDIPIATSAVMDLAKKWPEVKDGAKAAKDLIEKLPTSIADAIKSAGAFSDKWGGVAVDIEKIGPKIGDMESKIGDSLKSVEGIASSWGDVETKIKASKDALSAFNSASATSSVAGGAAGSAGAAGAAGTAGAVGGAATSLGSIAGTIAGQLGAVLGSFGSIIGMVEDAAKKAGFIPQTAQASSFNPQNYTPGFDPYTNPFNVAGQSPKPPGTGSPNDVTVNPNLYTQQAGPPKPSYGIDISSGAIVQGGSVPSIGGSPSSSISTSGPGGHFDVSSGAIVASSSSSSNSYSGGSFGAAAHLSASQNPFGFAEGGIIKEPTLMIGLKSGGQGIMAERGPEAILNSDMLADNTLASPQQISNNNSNQTTVVHNHYNYNTVVQGTIMRESDATRAISRNQKVEMNRLFS